MEADLLDTLSFSRVRAAVAERAATRFGMEAAEALAPCDAPAVAAERLDRVDEIAALGELPLGGIEDVREAVAAARDGRMLEGDAILQVAYTLDAVQHLRRAAASREQPRLGALAARMGTFDGWLRTVREQLDAEGRVRDDATPKLRDVRRRLRPLRGRIRSALEALLERHANAVQDPIVTLRRDRYVIPIRAEAQSQVPGIAIDASDSGKTVFVEPQSVVAMNNELALLIFEERDEVRRILFELGRALAAHEDLDATFEAVAALDVASASARLAEDWGLVRAVPSEAHDVELPAARHPLVEGCVANDVALDEARRLLVITGPNAGGKTVLLKTVGLAVAMAQAGLPVAAGVEGRPPRLPWFARVRADVGDEQSIEASLSTYAGHLTRLETILAEADAETLVLIDELGSGTDPDEGASLSQAILERVLASGAKGLVTTHLAPLKVFASDAAGVRNAAMRFDVDALAPTYQLVVGQPGRSYALAIAERLGLPEAVLARAQALLGPEGERLERLLEALEDQREQLAGARADAEREAGEARERAASLEAEIARLRAREDELLAEAAAKADAQLQATLQRATRLGKTAATDEGAGRSQALEEIRALRREAQRDAGRDRGRAPAGAAGGGGAAPSDPLVPGREVRVASYDAQGPITEVRGDRVWVQLGLLRVEVGRDEVELAPEPERVTHGGAAPDPSFGAGFDAELNVRGERAEAATEKVREFVLEAHALRVPTVRILHGKGTGALRDAVRETLRGEARVARYEDAVPYEGGHGVTVAHLDV